ncbi:MAG: 16S rRNA (guanine(966)-N(2))-methyltransferase RsmD [Thermoanaerobacterales bacterium]|nr:16S rRNA (guanine(966)-N(2))-methyltransferase RsmD [Bacillota bacterium]MDI6907319.1 16S rRNA (guanine(966)-N(2))-methyltransferase RsmD [Thermoanaerobacterales bacterium]
MLRIIGGSARGRRLKGPPEGSARPTSDRVREALFNILAPWVPGSRFLDLFAGSGAVGLEALSRGAARAVFVEANPRVAAVLQANLSATGLGPKAEVYRNSFERALADLAAGGESFDLVFIDPPYRRGLEDAALRALCQYNLLAPGGMAVAESDRTHLPPAEIAGLALWRRERYGDTTLSFYRRLENSGEEGVH